MAPRSLLGFTTTLLSFTTLVQSHPQLHRSNPASPFWRRQSDNGPIDGWTSIGCYTDQGLPRTLMDASFASDAMTPGLCTAFCSSQGFIFAGVEYARECFCGYSIQGSGSQVDPSQCNFACAGDSSLTCGAGNRIMIYTNGQPGPSAPETVGTWQYKGCYVDPQRQARALERRIDLPTAVDVESCTVGCKAEGFRLAGLEYGQECWCGNYVINGDAASAGDCTMTCIGDRSEFCGNAERLSLYQDSSAPIDFAACLQTQRYMFQLNAISKSSPSTPVPLKVIDVGPSPGVYYTLSACESCPTDWKTMNVVGSILNPLHPTGPLISDLKSFTVNAGDSPSFLNSATPPSLFNQYCTMPNPGNPISPILPSLALGARNHADLWALCPNSTEGGRLDVVYSPIEGHPHYAKSQCQEIYIQIV